MVEENIDEHTSRNILKKFWIFLATLFVLSSFGIWVYGWTGLAENQRLDLRTGEYRSDAADLLDDSTFGLSAEKICEKVSQAISELPKATEAVNTKQRATQIESGTSLLEAMIKDLRTLETGTDRDSTITSAWIDDWETVIKDRNRYTKALNNGEDSEFLMTDIGGSERQDKRITRLAETNQMPSCHYPEDIG